MRAIHIVTTRLSSSFRPILLDFLTCSPPRQFSIPKRFICAATKANGGGRSGSIVAPLVTEDFQKIDVNPPKGTRDFPPEDMRLRNWLFNHFKEVIITFKLYKFILCSKCDTLSVYFAYKVSRLFGYEEVDFPVLETEALFIRKAGEEIRDQVCISTHLIPLLHSYDLYLRFSFSYLNVTI